ncbi:MAG: glycosyltransferase family 4 protein [Phycisphaerae bacterium]|nr:glycosyltransferase family 4 protein [Phycisphaerae bacterium]
MKIGYVLRSLEDSGVTVYCLRLAEAMRRRGHDVFLVSDGGVYADEVKRRNLRHHPLPLCRGPLRSLLAARRLADIVRAERPDILHGNWRRAQMACHLAEKATGVPYVTTLHLVGIPDSWLYRRLSHWGRLTIAPCSEAVAYLQTHFGVPRERIRLIFHGVDPEQWPVATPERQAAARRQFGLPLEAPVLVCVARLEAVKRHDLLLRALAEVRRSEAGAGLRLLLVGDGQEREALRRLAGALGLSDAVSFLGFTDPHAALAAADAFVLASDKESFGFAPVEAMFTGRAVIRTDSEGARDQIVPGETGQIVPRGDVGTLAAAMVDVVARRGFWAECGARARAAAVRQFTLDQMAEQTERCCLDALATVGATESRNL